MKHHKKLKIALYLFGGVTLIGIGLYYYINHALKDIPLSFDDGTIC